MNCEECRSVIAVADLTDWGDMNAVAVHCRTCPACSDVVTQVRDSAQRVATLLDGLSPGVPAALVARRAEAEAVLVRERRRRTRFFVRLGSAGVMLAAGIAVFVVRAVSTPPSETMTLALNCIQGDYAAALLEPIMGRDGSVTVRTLGPRTVLRISGPPHVLAEAHDALARFDNAGSLPRGTACLTVPDMSAAEEARMEAEHARLMAEDARRAAEFEREAAAGRPR